MREDPDNHGGLFNGGDNLEVAATLRVVFEEFGCIICSMNAFLPGPRMMSPRISRWLLALLIGVGSASAAKTPQQIFADVSPSIVGVVSIGADTKKSSQGSGVVVAPKQVATNCHVLQPRGTIAVYYGKKVIPAHVIKRDDERDLCVLNAATLDAPAIRTFGATHSLAVGQPVYAIGNPLGLELTLTEGLISALRQTRQGRVIQISASIAPGSSGGGLFDSNGALIGITTATRSKNFQGFNFAVPTDWIRALDGASDESQAVRPEPVTPPRRDRSTRAQATSPDRPGVSHLTIEQDRAIAVAMSKMPTDPDQATPYLAFNNEGEGRRWLKDMSPRLQSRMPDRVAREEFLVTAHFEAKRAGLDPQLVLALIDVLSNFRKFAVSPSGARGYMQVNQTWPARVEQPAHNLLRLRTNLMYGCAILRAYLDANSGDLYHALRAYRLDSDPAATESEQFPNEVLDVWTSKWRYR